MISVCLASYNGEEFIKAQLLSILPQLSPGDELIVSDDGSKDNTCEIVRSISDPRITLVTGPKLGVVKNFESMLFLARGDYIFLSDQDDVWLPNKVDKMLGCLKYADVVVSDCYVVDKDLRTLENSFFKNNSSSAGLFNNLFKNGYLGCCMAFRKSIAELSLPFPASIPMHDWWIGLNGQCAGKIAFLSDQLSLYRRHGNNLSSTSKKSEHTIYKRIIWRLSLAYNLLKNYSRIRGYQSNPGAAKC